MHAPAPNRRKFVLLVDGDSATRSVVRPALPDGLQLVQSRTGNAALDLLQRVPERFGLALVALDLVGVPGKVVIDTIHLFRPGIRVICLSDKPDPAAAGGPCVAKAGDGIALRARVLEVWGGHGTSWTIPQSTPAAVELAKAAFALTGDLTAAARELQRGQRSGPANDS